MPPHEEDFSRIRKMQSLCSSTEQDLERIREFGEYLGSVEEKRHKLSDLYRADWLRLTESDELDGLQRQAVEAMVPEGHYSVFWQDTVWNALSDLRVEYVALLKCLAEKR